MAEGSQRPHAGLGWQSPLSKDHQDFVGNRPDHAGD